MSALLLQLLCSPSPIAPLHFVSLSAQQQKLNWLASLSLAGISELWSQINFAVLLAEARQRGDRAAKGREQGGSTESTVGREAEPGCTASRTRLRHEGKCVAPSLHHHVVSRPAKAASATRGDVRLECLRACRGCTCCAGRSPCVPMKNTKQLQLFPQRGLLERTETWDYFKAWLTFQHHKTQTAPGLGSAQEPIPLSKNTASNSLLWQCWDILEIKGKMCTTSKVL